MLKQLTDKELCKLFDKLAVDYRLLVPGNLTDATRSLIPWDGKQLLPAGEALQRKPTCHFFPQTDLLLTLDAHGTASLPPDAEKPLALCGLSREDLHGIAFVDRFFSAEPADDAYLCKRTDALLIGLTGFAGPDRQLLPLAEGYCDFELIADRQQWLAVAYTATGKEWLAAYADESAERLEVIRQQVRKLPTPEAELLQRASLLLQADQVPDLFWEEIAARCICCGGCNFACPTCTCFCLQDRQTATGVERSRVWDSCQLDAFMREASGYNPLGTESLRTRRRIHHKLVADPQRWGELGCILCGRCDRACPTGIGMFSICEEIVRRFDV